MSLSLQNFSGTTSNSTNNSSSTNNAGSSLTTNGGIHIYVIGAVKHPGVYILPAGARVYQLMQAAGSALPNADLVVLNLAAPLTDGGVPGSGTTGSATTGQLVNINAASSDEMRQSLHISTTTAQNIVNYRQQNGPFTSINQLQLIVSKSIFTRIKVLITI